jgi:hypothetical protein
MGVGCKNIFHVMYCVKPCVHGARGASVYVLGDATMVGQPQCRFCIAVGQIFN